MTKIFKSFWLLLIVILIMVIAFVIIFHSIKFMHPYSASLVQKEIELFVKSDKQKIKLSELFPWEWEYMCVTGDYASKESFEAALGRRATIGDYVTWYWYGRWFLVAEGVDNIIFEQNGVISVYQYEFLGRQSINLPMKVRAMGACVRNEDKLIIEKQFVESGQVKSLVVIIVN